MSASLETVLCTKCGLCCNGSFLADIEISREEALRLEAGGLEVEEEDGNALLIQPCAALKGKRCSIYAYRPKCCRTFECLLLKRARQGEVSVVKAGEMIERARTLRKQDAAAFQALANEMFLGRAVCS